MPFWKLYYHLVWTTKDRQSMIDPKLESQLYPFLIDKALSLGCHVDAINGMEEHVHVALSIPPKHSISKIVQHLKGASSHEFIGLVWQRGYGIFSLGEKQRRFAIEYVKNQKEHHRQKTTNQWLERCDDENDDE